MTLASKKITTVVDSVNERTRRVEQAQKLMELEENLEGLEEEFTLATDSRRMIREGPCKSGKNVLKTEVHLFLFNDILMVTKPLKRGHATKYQFEWKVPTSQIVVTVGESDGNFVCGAYLQLDSFDIFNNEKHKLYHFQFNNTIERDEWDLVNAES